MFINQNSNLKPKIKLGSFFNSPLFNFYIKFNWIFDSLHSIVYLCSTFRINIITFAFFYSHFTYFPGLLCGTSLAPGMLRVPIKITRVSSWVSWVEEKEYGSSDCRFTDYWMEKRGDCLKCQFLLWTKFVQFYVAHSV